ncbi:PREDICTED: succinate dehydrogenase assembly factor 3, mitochondrial [Ceratosolen solmsi marchali]|uniref:Succinate dehydrogenase assembly factor 3 n=1 Tax=Ceratosolen solmsi marchali TaxID=326594 RepID=A0AAJ7DYS2_9HYME|nr:PREDICTED: succinate dehydrogenase assembly factor 3, mitochondrial [Ceratosolen solmsi marchali]
MLTSWTHVQRVSRLYKMILRLHRSLPKDIKELGDVYVKSEFKRHKKCNSYEADVFIKEWMDYALSLSDQLNIRNSLNAKSLGKSLKKEDFEILRDEQIYQLYELMKAATQEQSKNE